MENDKHESTWKCPIASLGGEREQVSLFKFKVSIQFNDNRRFFREQSTKSCKGDEQIDNGSKE